MAEADWWRAVYKEIVKDLNLDEKKDVEAAYVLSSLLTTENVFHLHCKIRNKPCIVFGAGPSLEKDFKECFKAGLIFKTVVLAADGASSFLLSSGRNPDVIVTDLDGDVNKIIECSRKGSIVVVHAHGDNIGKVRKYVPLINRCIVGTTQTEEKPRVYNFGGFTDGDRCCYIAYNFNCSILGLAGMDFGEIVGRYSKPHLKGNMKANERKRKKLEWGKRLVEELGKKMRGRIYNLTSNGENLQGIPRIKPRNFLEVISPWMR